MRFYNKILSNTDVIVTPTTGYAACYCLPFQLYFARIFCLCRYTLEPMMRKRIDLSLIDVCPCVSITARISGVFTPEIPSLLMVDIMMRIYFFFALCIYFAMFPILYIYYPFDLFSYLIWFSHNAKTPLPTIKGEWDDSWLIQTWQQSTQIIMLLIHMNVFSFRLTEVGLIVPGADPEKNEVLSSFFLRESAVIILK